MPAAPQIRNKPSVSASVPPKSLSSEKSEGSLRWACEGSGTHPMHRDGAPSLCLTDGTVTDEHTRRAQRRQGLRTQSRAGLGNWAWGPVGFCGARGGS